MRAHRITAFVLGGGSIRGAFQVGALQAIFEDGFKPVFVDGNSVGALNATFIASEAGKRHLENPDKEVEWAQVGQFLKDFWINNIRKPSDIISKHGLLRVGWKILIKRFDGFSSSLPLRKLLYKTASLHNIKSSPVELGVIATNVAGGNLIHATTGFPDLLDYVMASSSIPFAMPVEMIGKVPYYDGGVRSSAPLKQAVERGAAEVVCIANHPKKMSAIEINTGDIMQLADRTSDIHSNAILNSDIDKFKLINELCPEDGTPKQDEPFKGKRKIPLTLIRPYTELPVNITNFDQKDISNMIDSGYQTANKILSIKNV